jgi:hypothetical protein
MKHQTYTVNAAVEILEKNPRLIIKALRHVPPDEVLGKQKRWRMETITDALDRLPSAVEARAAAHKRSDNYCDDRYDTDDWEDINNIASMWRDHRIIDAQEEFDAAFEAMAKLLSLAARRSEAKKLGNKLKTKHENFLLWGKENGTDDDVTGWRADQILSLERRRFKAACQWTKSEFRKNFDGPWWKENLAPDHD